MRFQMSARSLRICALALVSLFAASCGTGDGEESVEGSADSIQGSNLRLLFRDDFGGPAAAPRGAGLAAMSAPAPLPPGDWVVETGYGVNGWGNDEWQRYTNSIDNVFVADGNLVLRAQCANAPNCGKRDDTITSGKVITKNRLNVRYGRIRARIKMPSGLGMWPAFWTLGSDIDSRPWPDAGEIDIVEMHYFYSDIFTTHFTTHWSGPRYTPSNRPACASGVGSSLDPNEEENCKTGTKTFATPLTDGYHIFELDWNENRIVGKIDGITYFEQAIDAATMEEFLKDHYLILNVAVGGTLGGPFGPSMSAADWADPDQTDMKVDWVEVWERVPPTTATLIDESGNNLRYNRIINSVEFGGAFVGSKLKSTAVPALVGNSVLELNYSNSVSQNGGVPASYSGAIFDFNNLDVSPFNKFVFSLDASRFPRFNDIGVEFEDSTGSKVLVRTRNYPPMSVNGNWKTYGIPFRDFAGVDMNDIVRIGFFNPNAAPNDVIEIGYVGANTLAGISFGDPNNKSINLDISNLAGGTLEFDAMVTEAGSAPWRIKFESEFAAAEVLLSQSVEGVAPQVGQWQRFTFPLDTTLGAVDLSSVKYLTFFTTFAPSSGRIRIDNVVFKPGAGNPAAEVVAFDDDLASQWVLWDCCSGGATQINDISIPDTTLLAGTLFVDDIRFVTETCNALPAIEFDSIDYNPAAVAARLSVNDLCAASSLGVVKIENASSEIFVGVKLDAAGNGEAIVNLVTEASACPTDDEFSILTLTGTSITATYKEGTASEATATAGIDPSAVVTELSGDELYFYATDPNQQLAFLPDAPVFNSFNFSVFGSGSQLNGSFADPTFNPVFEVRSGGGYGTQVAQIVLINLPTGFAADAESINFKFRNVGSPSNTVTVEFGGAGVATTTSTIDLADPTRSTSIGGGWFEVKVPMSAFPDVGSYTFVAFTSAPNPITAVPFSFRITDIFLEEKVGSLGPECAAPATPPAAPTEDPANVISLFSDVYPDVMVDTWSTVWDSTEVADTALQGNAIKRYDTLGFAGIETVVMPVDASGMDNFRFDAWSTGITTLRVKLVDFGGDGFGGGNDTEASVDIPLTPGEWTDVNIALSALVAGGLNAGLNNISQYILEAVDGSGVLFIDNVYFFDIPAPPSELGVFSETFTDPTIALGPFINSIGFGGNNTVATPVVANPSVNGVTAFDGNVLEIDYQNTGGTFGGALFDFGGVDITAYDTLKFSINTSQFAGFANLTIQIEPPGGPQPGNNVALASYAPVSTSGDWSTYEIPLADFPGATLSAVGVVGFWNARDGSDALVYGKLYLDDVHFVGPGPTTLGVFSETHTSPAIALGPFINSIGFGGNNTVATPVIANPAVNGVTAYDGNALEIDYQNTGAVFGGSLFNFGGVDVTPYAVLKFAIDTSQIPGFANLTIQIEPPGGPQPGNNVALASYAPVSTSGTWSVYEIPLADFPGATLSAVGVVGFWNVRDVADALVFGQLYLDDVHFSVTSTGGGGGGSGTEIAVNGDFETGDTSNWNIVPNGALGSFVIDNSVNNGGAFSVNITQDDSAGPPLIVQNQPLGVGTIVENDDIIVTFDVLGTLQAGCVLIGQLDNIGGGPSTNVTIDAGFGVNDTTWTTASFNGTVSAAAATNGMQFQFVVPACGAGAILDVNVDNVSVEVQP